MDKTLRLFSLVFFLAVYSEVLPADSGKKYHFEIPQQTMTGALNLFAEQAKLQVLYPYKQIEGKLANQLSGLFLPEEAIVLLLKDTGVSHTFSKKGILTVKPIVDNERTKRQAVNATSKKLTGFSAVLAALFGSSQSLGANNSQKDRELSLMEEVLVTVQRREERVQDVPISIAVFSGNALEDSALETATDIFSQTPNVSTQHPTGSAGFPIFNIRGVTLLDFSDTNEASVAIYVDDVYLGSPAIQNQQLFDIERVEILRGPQGTLYGRNATGGLVNFITRRPSDEFEANVSVSYGSYDNYELEAVVSGALTENFRSRLAVTEGGRDNWQKNLTNGSEFGGIDTKRGARLTTEFDANKDLLITANVHYGLYEGNAEARALFGQLDPVSGNPCSLAQIFSHQCVDSNDQGDPAPDPEYVYSDLTELPNKSESLGAWLRFDWDLGFATFTSISSYDEADKLDTSDSDGSSKAALELIFSIDHKQYSQEFRLTGETERLNWVLGSYYYQDERFFTATLPLQGGYGSWADQDIETYAVFAQSTWAATETLNLTLGVRYTDDSRDLNDIAAITGGNPGTNQGTPLFQTSSSLDSSRNTWRAAVDWHFTDNQMLYASVSTGFKSGAFNTLLPATADGVVPAAPEYTTAYELGVKGVITETLLLSYNIAAFYTDYENVQAQGTIADPTPISSLDTVGDARIHGIEAEFSLRPINSLIFSFGIGYLDAEYKADGNVQFNGVTLNDNRPVMTPNINLNTSIRYEHLLSSNNRVFAVFDYRWQDDVFFGPDNLPIESEDAYGVANFSLGWVAANEALEITGFVKNIADEEYFIHSFNGGAGSDFTANQWGMPRTWGIKFKVNF